MWRFNQFKLPKLIQRHGEAHLQYFRLHRGHNEHRSRQGGGLVVDWQGGNRTTRAEANPEKYDEYEGDLLPDPLRADPWIDTFPETSLNPRGASSSGAPSSRWDLSLEYEVEDTGDSEDEDNSAEEVGF